MEAETVKFGRAKDFAAREEIINKLICKYYSGEKDRVKPIYLPFLATFKTVLEREFLPTAVFIGVLQAMP